MPTVACGGAGNHSVSGAVIITPQILAGRSPFKANLIRRQLLFVATLEYLGNARAPFQGTFSYPPIAGIVPLSRKSAYRPGTLFLLQPLNGSLRLQIGVRISNQAFRPWYSTQTKSPDRTPPKWSR
jgi:hypothetical protein